MACIFGGLIKRLNVGFIVVAIVFVASLALAMEQPRPGELEALQKDPVELAKRLAYVEEIGNNRMNPLVAQRAEALFQAKVRGENVSMSSFPAIPGIAFQTGTNKVLAILVDFPEGDAFYPEIVTNELDGLLVTNQVWYPAYPAYNDRDYIQSSLFEEGNGGFPYESMKNYYQRSSYGKLVMTGTALPWYHAKHPRAWYDLHAKIGGLGGLSERSAILKEALDYWDPYYDFSQFDNNGDGYIDYTCAFWAGPDTGWATFWWGVMVGYGIPGTYDGVQASGALSWQWEGSPVGAIFSPVVCCHETGHYLGAPDYYDTKPKLPDGIPSPDSTGGLGNMDEMDSNNTDHNGYTKGFCFGWLDPVWVTTNLYQFPLRRGAQYPDALIVPSPVDPYEVFLVQNRAGDLMDNDMSLPGNGMMIMHISGHFNHETIHKGFKWVQADGLDHIERGINGGDVFDFFHKGQDFTHTTVPSSDFYPIEDWGVTSNWVGRTNYPYVDSQIRITGISFNQGTLLADYTIDDNHAVFIPTNLVVMVTEGGTTTVGVAVNSQPRGDVALSVGFLSGSTNLYLIGNTNFVFTTSDWNVPQPITFVSRIDADYTNDKTVFISHDANGWIRDIKYKVEQSDVSDLIPPKCSIRAYGDASRTNVTFEFSFDESVFGFTTNDISIAHNIAGGVSLIDLVDVTVAPESNRLYRARFVCADVLGSFTVSVPAAAVVDLGSNGNPPLSQIYTLPSLRTDLKEGFDGLLSSWTISTNAATAYMAVCWRWGLPVFANTWSGPALANSLSNCWGTMAGPYAKPIDGWIQSPVVGMGAYPVLSFNLWLGSSGTATVEALVGSTYTTISPTNLYTSTGGLWQKKTIVLSNEVYGGRSTQFRFRARGGTATNNSCAMYIDDVRVESQQAPGVWLISCSPTNGPVNSTVPVVFSVYNSTTSAQAGVTGEVTSPDAGVTIASGVPLSYGSIVPGAVVTGAAPVQLRLGAASAFPIPMVSLFHKANVGGVTVSSEIVPFKANGVSVGSATNLLIVRSSSGVTHFSGQYLVGNGGPTSSLFQVIYAGANGAINAPTANGQVTGDDQLLYSAEAQQLWGRFGEGDGVLADWGRFTKTFAHNLNSNALVYIRAWDSSSFDTAMAYGDSALYAVKRTANESHDFGTWDVKTPLNYSGASLPAMGDIDGDSIPDGWWILSGINPNKPIGPLGNTVKSEGQVTGLNGPGRVAVSSNWVFIADTGNNRIDVRGRGLTNLVGRYGSFASSSATNFNTPQGLAVNAAGTRLVVADTGNNRVKVMSVNPATGALSNLFVFGTQGAGAGTNFNTPYGVSFGPGDTFYVADSHPNLACNQRIQGFLSNGDPSSIIGSVQGQGTGLFYRPLGVGLNSGGNMVVADTYNNVLQGFTNGAFAWQFGGFGTNVAQFKYLRDAKYGVNNRVYVTDTYNNRLQVFDVSGAPGSIIPLGIFGSGGTAVGQFNYPQGAVPAPDDNVIYVADTSNNRVQKLRITIDADGDGMDDVWENLHGVTDPFADPDGDGLSNIGEYRLGTDPKKWDSNGNGASDGWDIAHGLNPASLGGPVVTPPVVVITSDAGGYARPAGSVVRITATFSESVTNLPGPRLSLSGGATLSSTGMIAQTAARWYFDYTVQSFDLGAVDASVSGAVDLQGLTMDLDPTVTNGLFMASVFSLDMSSFSLASFILKWNAVLNGQYKIQTSTNLILNAWQDASIVTSPGVGVMSWTNAGLSTNRTKFFRVQWLNVP